MAVIPQNDPTLLEKVSAEVAPEVSPLLVLISKNIRTIVFVLVACVVGVISYGVYTWYSAGQREAAATELGRIAIMADSGEKIAALERFIGKAPKGVTVAATLALAKTATESRDYEKAAAAWASLAAMDNQSYHAVARIGQAEALMQLEKGKEALALLQALAPQTTGPMRVFVESAIVNAAEKTADYPAAIKAAEALASNPDAINNADHWHQKVAALRQLQAPAAPVQ